MQSLKYLLLPVSVIFGLVLIFAFVRSSQSILSGSLLENSKELVGQKLDLKELGEFFQDQRIAEGEGDLVLVFWSTTCAPCLEELPQLSTQAQTLVIPINTDPPEFRADAERVSQILAPQFKFIGDDTEYLQKQFKVKFVPTHVVINKAGVIDDIRVGKVR